MNFKKVISVVIIGLSVLAILTSQRSAFAQGTVVEKPPVGGPRRQLGTIIYAGLGGAVLGLSTLSFYGRPQDKLANIAIGFAVGVIAGTASVTYSAATNPDEFYGATDSLLGPSPLAKFRDNKKTDDFTPVFSTSFFVATF